MKKILFLSVMVLGIFIHARSQQGATLELNMTPERMEILPGVFEFHADNRYALTVNKDLVDSISSHIKKGESVLLNGPVFEQLVQDKCIRDYADIRSALEKSLRDSIAKAKKALKAISPFYLTQKRTARQALENAEEMLLAEQLNTQKNLAILKNIVQRKAQSAIYIYNWKVVPKKVQQNGGSGGGLDPNKKI